MPITIVRTLISEYDADITARDDKLNAPVHVAASTGGEISFWL